jgi:hypothetical protein
LPRKAKPKVKPAALAKLKATSLRHLPHKKYGAELTANIPDYVEPFVAYRAWNWTETQLTSLNHAAWTPKVAFEASCSHLIEGTPGELDPTIHPVPCETCTCGMYAGINMQHLIDIGYIQRGIHGEVYLWGRLYRHTLGWRAQYAYPKNFIVPASMLPFELREFERRMKVLTDFDVDIYLQTEKEARVGQTTLPLWIKDYGYSQQGLDFILTERAQWKPPQVEGIKVGDRIAILHERGGIGIVHKIEEGHIWYDLFGKFAMKIPLKAARWNHRNWRWESHELGAVTRTQ